MACLFCEIVAGEKPAHVVLDDDATFAFLDIRPLFPGHTLVVPKVHYETMLDIPPDELGVLYERVRRIAAAVESALGAQGSFVATNNRVSQSVPHLHVHVVPRRKGDGLRGFFWPRQKYGSDEDAAATAAALRAAIPAR